MATLGEEKDEWQQMDSCASKQALSMLRQITNMVLEIENQPSYLVFI